MCAGVLLVYAARYHYRAAMNDPLPLILSTIPPHTGKRIGDHLWLHASSVHPEALAALRTLVTTDHPVALDDLVIRVDQRKHRIAHLHYPRFLATAHPALCCSALVDIARGTASLRSFERRPNRPILHRKELLVAAGHEAYNEFAALTAEEERLGLLDDKRRIGWSSYWSGLLRERGLVIEGHEIRELRTDD